jgi:hypothetical protein
MMKSYARCCAGARIAQQPETIIWQKRTPAGVLFVTPREQTCAQTTGEILMPNPGESIYSQAAPNERATDNSPAL